MTEPRDELATRYKHSFGFDDFLSGMLAAEARAYFAEKMLTEEEIRAVLLDHNVLVSSHPCSEECVARALLAALKERMK